VAFHGRGRRRRIRRNGKEAAALTPTCSLHAILSIYRCALGSTRLLPCGTFSPRRHFATELGGWRAGSGALAGKPSKGTLISVAAFRVGDGGRGAPLPGAAHLQRVATPVTFICDLSGNLVVACFPSFL